MPSPLPIDAITPRFLSELRRGQNVVLEAPPGAGKTTRIPPACLTETTGDVLVLEPRRIAARMAARRVAEERGERVGETVGYQVRFEEVAGPKTRLRFLTQGVLTRRLLSDPQLRGVSVVILDEFHERHLDADLALALLRKLQQTTRPDLKLIVMSATLDATPIAAYLGDCPVLRSEGRMFDVDIAYAGHSAAPLEQQVAAAVGRVAASNLDGDVLVFLPGSAEIRRAARACQPLASRAGLLIAPLYGDLPPEEQDRAVQPSDRPKIILSTNLAESSITIEGVTTVIDSGLARIASDAPGTGLPTLEVSRISKASAAQRAGRAGRVRPGRAIRLYSVEDYSRRPEHDIAEIHRRELSQVLLELRVLGAADVRWYEPPPAASWQAAEDLLDRLGAREDAPALARYPLHPRLARFLIEAGKRGCAGAACRLAAILSAGERYAALDILDLLDREPSYRVQQIDRQVRRIVRPGPDRVSADAELRMALLTAFPDRVARRRGGSDVQYANGRAATLSAEWRSDLLLAIDVEDRRDQGAPIIRLASVVEPEWLLDMFPERVRERNALTWNRAAERVESSSALLFDEVVIDETRESRPDPTEAAALLAEKAFEYGLHRFVDSEELESFGARIEFAAAHSPLRMLTESDLRDTVAEMCNGQRSFSDLKQAMTGFLPALKLRLGPDVDRILNEVAPERLLVKGRQVKVNYVRGQAPSIASRLQDFFGVRETPRVARGAVPVVMQLLAPNRRPVQTTTDLAGFWERLYPQVRRELSRRYPRHAWPENPA